jgi:pimeloyl-ACP methyl ester carboxylesterase
MMLAARSRELLTGLCLAATSCARTGAVLPSSGSDVQVATAERMVDVGGRRLHATVHGRGAPTVVLLSALGATQDYWHSIMPALAAQATVLTYDRAGVGKSQLGTLPAQEQSATDLRVLLDALRLPRPYLLVGHSFGGNVARIFASMYPADIAGLVLEETQHEDNLDEMKKLLTGADLETFEQVLAPGFAPPPDPRTERDYRAATRTQLQGARPLPHVPFVVLTVAGRGRDMQSMFSAAATDRIVALDSTLMQGLAASVPGGRHIFVEGSGHNLHVDRPEALLAPLRSMIADIKARTTGNPGPGPR